LKQLSLVRHAKSDWNNQLSDYYRPLNKRGVRDAPLMGKRLFDFYGKPDLIISSGAKRAISTAEYFSISSNYKIDDIITNDELYHASSNKIIEIIQSLDLDFFNVWIFSHNPGISDTATELCGKYIEMKTCCVANIELQSNKWRDFDFGKCEIKNVLTPKDN
jgi:phosphohistidine phosphatase